LPQINKKLLLAALAITCSFLNACSSTPEETCLFETDPFDPLLPFPYGEVKDPSDTDLYESVRKLVQFIDGPPNSRFDYTRIDLDGDGQRDALVYMKAPYSHWCGQHGCTLFVMKAGVESFDYVSEVRPIRPPLIVTRNTSNGWKDIMVRVDGRWSKTKDVALKYNGRSYPLNPESQPPARKYAFVDGIKVFP
jgi:hypothetical protein